MCYNAEVVGTRSSSGGIVVHHNNPSWCDETRNEYYDNYFDQHGENPWGDRNRATRKCNTVFGKEGSNCNHNWQCQKGYCLVEGGFLNVKQYCSCALTLLFLRQVQHQIQHQVQRQVQRQVQQSKLMNQQQHVRSNN